MADTPILNYKGKYDGPEIDKAVELALDLENPKSCPYYVHVSLSQPDYVLTIGLGDAEGNPFNQAEIDLPLESMVVNATYSNGNIILHLQDGTSTEPIPISALIAGLVSETRTIAGIDLEDDITQKELRDALDVYTKDSVDLLVSDLENRIDETLNEMEQSLDDLSELTSEHDMQIKKNTSDIAVNRATLGISSKNLAKITATTITNNGVTATVNSDKSVTLNGTATKQFETTIGVFSPKEKGTYILSRRPENSNGTSIRITDGQNFNIYLSQAEITLNITNLKDYSINILVTSGTTVNNLVYQPMIRYADITDSTYEPYKPSVNERLVEVEESVSELTPQVEQNKSDILSAQNQIDTQTLITTSGEANSKNWYRAFEVSQKGAVRTGIILINRGYSNGLPEQYILSINIGYYANKINLISRFIEKDSNNVGRAYIDKIRIVRATSSPSKNNCYIDIHYNSDLINVIYASLLANTTNSEAFSPANFSVAEIPEGYTSVEFDLTDKDVFERLTALETALTQTTE